jgi:transcriptional regulator with XRE-family HTH domain
LPFCHIALKSQRTILTPYPKELKTIGDYIRKRRLDLELLQKDVAKLIGVTEATIYDWESNRTSPRFRYTPRIIEFLGYWPYDTPATTLGARILRARKLRGITQKELAKSFGVDQSTVESWEKDEHRPLKRYWDKLSSLLGVEVSPDM